MSRKERYQHFLEYFKENAPNPETELNYTTPFELLVAVILSAQCTDKRVNEVTPALFKSFPDAEAMSKADFDTLFPLIKSVSYPNNKTKHLIGMAKMLIHDFNDEIPDTVENLQKLPGVGRKTANVIASVIYKSTHHGRRYPRIQSIQKARISESKCQNSSGSRKDFGQTYP